MELNKIVKFFTDKTTKTTLFPIELPQTNDKNKTKRQNNQKPKTNGKIYFYTGSVWQKI